MERWSMSEGVGIHMLVTDELRRLALLEEDAAEPLFGYHDEYWSRRYLEVTGKPYLKSRWVPMIGTTPSGKTLYRCRGCFRFSIAPDKRCEAGCERQEA